MTGPILLRSKSFGWQFRVECPELRGEEEEEEEEKKIIYLDTFSFSLPCSFFFFIVVVVFFFLCSLP